jgi:hypothetical protein
MTEERKHAILFAATLLCARKMIEIMDSDKPTEGQSAQLGVAVRLSGVTKPRDRLGHEVLDRLPFAQNRP